jgi:hypothetical protein
MSPLVRLCEVHHATVNASRLSARGRADEATRDRLGAIGSRWRAGWGDRGLARVGVPFQRCVPVPAGPGLAAPGAGDDRRRTWVCLARVASGAQHGVQLGTVLCTVPCTAPPTLLVVVLCPNLGVTLRRIAHSARCTSRWLCPQARGVSAGQGWCACLPACNWSASCVQAQADTPSMSRLARGRPRQEALGECAPSAACCRPSRRLEPRHQTRKGVPVARAFS